MRIAIACLLFLGFLCVSHPSSADDATTQPAYDWKSLDPIIGAKGELKNDVYTYTIPRTDLNVSIDAMDVPPAAGIASQFYFYQCSCGKIRVVGQFCCADYEANDVIDAIRPGALLEVASTSAMFLNDKPRITLVRFQGEGDPPTLARLLKTALDWTGPARTTPSPVH